MPQYVPIRGEDLHRIAFCIGDVGISGRIHFDIDRRGQDVGTWLFAQDT